MTGLAGPDYDATISVGSGELALTTDHGSDWSYPGARWWKFDFHAHTPKSADYGKGPQQATLMQIKPRDWLLGFMRARVDCVAVTDHNTGEWIDKLKNALQELEQEGHPEFRSLYLFPGVELSVNPGFHLLAILDTDKTTSDVDTLLGAVGYDGSKGDSDSVTRKSAVEVVGIVLDAGGVPVPAHTDDYKGLLRLKCEGSKKAALDANTLGQVLDSSGILAMEVIDAGSDKPDLYRQRKLTWTEVLGSDSHHPSGGTGERFPGSHFTWVKMAEPSLEGLRLALLDGGNFSIRRSDNTEPFDPFVLPKHRIESIDITDARYMGHGQSPAKLEFNPWLNALVGGRGTGKSTVVHALRLAARRDWELERLEDRSEPHVTFERFKRVPSDRTKDGGLKDTTSIQWTLVRDSVRHRVHWRQNGTGTTVEDQSGVEGWMASTVQSVTPERFPVRIYSQGQIAELAGDNPTALLDVVDQPAGVAPLLSNLAEAVAAFQASRSRIREIDSKLYGLEDTLAVGLQDVERKLKRFEGAGHTAILTAYRHRERQRREVDRQFEAVNVAAERIEGTAEELQLEDIPDGLFSLASEDDRQISETMNILRTAVNTVAQELRATAQRLRRAAETQREKLTTSDWQALVNQTADAYRRLVKDLEAEGVTDPNEYGTLVQARQRLDGEMKILESEKEQRSRLVKKSQEHLEKVWEARRMVTRARHDFLSCALAQNNYVRIEIRPYGDDPQIIERSLREALNVVDERFSEDILTTGTGSSPKGIVPDLLKGLPEELNGRGSEVERRLKELKERFVSACGGNGDFGGFFSNYLKREFGRRPELLDKLLTWFPEDGLNVRYSRTGDGKDFQPISQASAGQRSAAMLAFLLAHGEEPLVLDQPEDDLDNHLIYDLVVRQIRENKLRRQIIVVTHNPNIVVNGDAEMVHALAFESGQCVVKESGSLQQQAIREEVCQVMEGGREAFERRYRRLGRELSHV